MIHMLVCECRSCRTARASACALAVLLAVLACLLSCGCISRQYTVNVYGDAPVEFRINADVEHSTPITPTLKASLK